MYNELLKSINNFYNFNILVIGDIMLDKYYMGDVDKISQEAPVPIVNINQIENILGGSGNVANCIKSLGANCTIIGQIGNDQNGDTLKSILIQNDIRPVLNVNSNIITTTKNRVMSRTNQQMLRFDEEIIYQANNGFIQGFIYTKISSYDAIVISDYGKGCINNDILEYVNKKCKSRNIPIFLDPSPKTNYKNKMENTYLLPNNFEAKQLDLSKFPTRIITRGREGIEIITDNDPKCVVEPLKVEEVWNTTGAGDVVTSLFSISKLSGLDNFKSALLSNIGAGISIKKPVTYPVSKDELLEEVECNKELLESIN